jgi:hypothetical protein
LTKQQIERITDGLGRNLAKMHVEDAENAHFSPFVKKNGAKNNIFCKKR